MAKKTYDNAPSEALIGKALLNTNPYFISGTDKVDFTRPAYAIQFKETSVIAAIESNIQGDTLVAEEFPAGFVLYGSIYSITLTSGACVAHRI